MRTLTIALVLALPLSATAQTKTDAETAYDLLETQLQIEEGRVTYTTKSINDSTGYFGSIMNRFQAVKGKMAQGDFDAASSYISNGGGDLSTANNHNLNQQGKVSSANDWFKAAKTALDNSNWKGCVDACKIGDDECVSASAYAGMCLDAVESADEWLYLAEQIIKMYE
jgi:hypothetical protein